MENNRLTFNLTKIFFLLVSIFLLLGLIKLTESGSSEITNRLNVFYHPALKKIDITNLEYIKSLEEKDIISIRACPAEYEPFSIILSANDSISNLSIKWNSFEGNNNLPGSIMDAFIIKGWFQAGISSKDIRDTSKIVFVQELLLKDDSLVKVDMSLRKNYLHINYENSQSEYIDVTSRKFEFPDSAKIFQAKHLKPFSIDSAAAKQLWFTIQVPENAAPGIYSNQIEIIKNDNTINSQQIELEVLPFKLDSSILRYGLYYHGELKDYQRKYHFIDRDEERLEMELTDLKNHGVLYPTIGQSKKYLNKHLQIRNKVGLPNDRLFSTDVFNIHKLFKSDSIQNQIKNDIENYKSIIKMQGYNELYVYGIDEAKGKLLIKQRDIWKEIRKNNAKIFVAVNSRAFNLVGDLLDAAVLHGELMPNQAKLYQSIGHEIYSYHNPQVGQENPEVYRRNYGLALWKAGYNGAMNYAYFKSYGNVWNDFDDPRKRYREETFVYPTEDGLISTIQWEGFREAVDDVKYLTTLLNRIEKLEKLGIDAAEFKYFVDSIDPNDDLDFLRNEIINNIIEIDKSF
ncbi:MAG: DUF4091 domain-containing protein [Ignavibacteriae bacterium]|nr:DUF4091 domain-containing protein [Ignavibacteriota bacterium]NOH00033.1 DUF4091 domain-containing protein [Ignavibacteriota bacterium]